MNPRWSLSLPALAFTAVMAQAQAQTVTSPGRPDLTINAHNTTPRVYQVESARSDVLAREAALEAAADRQPRTYRARRKAMVTAIRNNVAAAGSSMDMAALQHTLDAIGRISREQFVPESMRKYAYLPTPVPIGYDQTVSDSYIVAIMTAAVHPRQGDTVLDVGTGSGFQAAVLSLLAQAVVSIEIVPDLAAEASARLTRLRYSNVTVIAGDGFGGVPSRAPFDAIIVAAGARAIPPALLAQLRPGGRLVMPIGPTTFEEQLILVTKSQSGTVSRCSLGPAAFVPFTGNGMASIAPRRADKDPAPLCFNAPVS